MTDRSAGGHHQRRSTSIPLTAPRCIPRSAALLLRLGAAPQGADRYRGGRPHRCAVRDRARDQWRGSGRAAPRASREQYTRVSPGSKIGKAITYSLNLWDALVRFLDDGRLRMSNNAAERAMRPVDTGRRNWTFAGSDEGGRRAATIYSLIETAMLKDVDPLAWLADILARIQAHPAKRIDELLRWNWQHTTIQQRAAA